MCSPTLTSEGVVRPGCGRPWTAFNECHCRTCHRHFSTVRNFDAHQSGRNGECVDPELIFDKQMEPKFKKVITVWGELYVGAKDRPADIDVALF